MKKLNTAQIICCSIDRIWRSKKSNLHKYLAWQNAWKWTKMLLIETEIHPCRSFSRLNAMYISCAIINKWHERYIRIAQLEGSHTRLDLHIYEYLFFLQLFLLLPCSVLSRRYEGELHCDALRLVLIIWKM